LLLSFQKWYILLELILNSILHSFCTSIYFNVFVYIAVLFSETATLPSKITALSGSCVWIPCAFEVLGDKLRRATRISGIWIKHYHAFREPGSLVVYNGSTNITTGFNRIEITGNLSQLDCTTVFYDMMSNHSDNYYFRVEIMPDWLYSYQNASNILVSGEWGSILYYSKLY